MSRPPGYNGKELPFFSFYTLSLFVVHHIHSTKETAKTEEMKRVHDSTTFLHLTSQSRPLLEQLRLPQVGRLKDACPRPLAGGRSSLAYRGKGISGRTRQGSTTLASGVPVGWDQ